MDVEIASVLNKKPTVLPTEPWKDLDTMKLGRIRKKDWSVAFQIREKPEANFHRSPHGASKGSRSDEVGEDTKEVLDCRFSNKRKTRGKLSQILLLFSRQTSILLLLSIIYCAFFQSKLREQFCEQEVFL